MSDILQLYFLSISLGVPRGEKKGRRQKCYEMCLIKGLTKSIPYWLKSEGFWVPLSHFYNPSIASSAANLNGLSLNHEVMLR